ncbi:MAG: TonB-dependent hemoglobin/transferrin/lactoferrin family receptor [Sphingomonadales bacterium]|nr:TonB-dependent hemoglobin/transferrin/lactoferrin family receptor [Sphingomonadales bacterium]MBK9269066.1 TonB-dependent hemoglobin/transferrin/lactoferrin family receptor [Sphingomonadales bacterium]
MLSAPASAQDNDGEYWLARKNEITVTATRAPMLVSEAPATVTVKSDEDIADELATDIKDMIRFEPGVSVTRQPARFGAALGTTGRGGNEGFTIRGIGGNRVLIQVDGVRVPDGFSFGAQTAGRGDYVDIGLVKSVEILRGPVSALYGSDGLAGAISFITSDPADIVRPGESIGGLVRASYSSDDEEFAETAIIAAKGSAVSGMFAYTRRDFSELENQGSLGTNNGIGSTRTLANPQDGRSNAFLARLVFEPGSGHKLRLTGEYIDTRLDAEILSGLGNNGLGAVVDSLTAHDTGERKRVTADWSWQGEGLIESARVAAYWQDAFDRQFTEELRTPSADRTRINTFENRVYGASADLRAGFTTGPLRHTLVFGSEVSFTRQQGLRGGTVPPAGETYPTRAFPVTDFMLGGVFVGDEINIGDGAVTLYPALRWDRYVLDPIDDPLLPTFTGSGSSGSKLSPKFGAVVKLSENIRLFGNYARGFKAPSPTQVNQFFQNLTSPFGSYVTIPAPNLRPETSESFEGGVRLTSDSVTGSITAFKANYDDFISQEVIGGTGSIANPIVYQFINISKAEVDGIEAKLDVHLPSGFNARVAAAYARGTTARPGAADARLSSIDPFTAVMGVGYREPRDNRFGGQFILTYSGQKGLRESAGVCGFDAFGRSIPCYRPDAAFLLDFTAHVRIGEAITLRGGVFNIFDSKYALWSDVRGLTMTQVTAPTAASAGSYRDPASSDAYTRPGRNASVSLSFRF